MFRPGSALWLLRHEVRLYVYNLGESGKKGAARRGMTRTSIAIWGTLLLVMHGVALMLVHKLSGDSAGLPPQAGMVLTLILAALMTMMLSTGLRASVEALFERGDLDLLLSSPLSSRSIFTVRLGGVVLGVAGVYLLFLAPMAHAGLILGHYRWLGIYPTIISIAMIVASFAMLFTLALVRTLGVRRTRVVAQIIGAVAGAIIFLVSQAYSSSLNSDKQGAMKWLADLFAYVGRFGPDSLAWLPGRALVGEPLPVLVLLLTGCAVFLFTVRSTHAFFVRGVQQSGGMARVAAPPAALHFNFRRSLAAVVLLKEWRLIARDPQLISQILLQLLYLLPLCFLLFFRKGDFALPGVAAAMCFLASSITGSLGRIIISAEDAPDLLLSAPCSQATIRRAKLGAVALPPLALVALPLAWIGVGSPVLAALMALPIACAVVSVGLAVMKLGKPVRRGELRTAGKGNLLVHLAEGLLGFGWAGIAYLLPWLAMRSV
jgi:ABC-2 type transport system permease protein